MRRDFNVLKEEGGFEPGDDYAASKATALAQIADATTIEKLVQAISMLDMVGGQFYMQAVRAKYDSDGNLIRDEDAKGVPGRWQTVGYVFRFETTDPAIMAHRDSPFVVSGPIDARPHDLAELANNATAAAMVADAESGTGPEQPAAE